MFDPNIAAPGFNLPIVEHSGSAISTENNNFEMPKPSILGNNNSPSIIHMPGGATFNQIQAAQLDKEQRVLNKSAPAEKAVRKIKNKEEEKKKNEYIDDVNKCKNCGEYEMVDKNGFRTCQACGAIADKLY